MYYHCYCFMCSYLLDLPGSNQCLMSMCLCICICVYLMQVWGLSLFLLHEYYKEMAGRGSKWGPYLRTLRVRSLSTPTVHALADTRAIELMKAWAKDIYDLR